MSHMVNTHKKYLLTKLYWVVIRYPRKKNKRLHKVAFETSQKQMFCCSSQSLSGQLTRPVWSAVFHRCVVTTKHLGNDFCSACGTNTAIFIFKNIYVTTSNAIILRIHWLLSKTHFNHIILEQRRGHWTWRRHCKSVSFPYSVYHISWLRVRTWCLKWTDSWGDGWNTQDYFLKEKMLRKSWIRAPILSALKLC